MYSKIKNFLSRFSKKRKHFWFVLFLAASLLVLPAFKAQAFSIGGAIAGSLLSVAMLIPGLLLSMTAAITQALLYASAQFFSWVVSDNFVSLSFTDPSNNPFLAVGLDITRGVANIIFIVALIAIGLGTALRLTGYQAKKALPTLLIIALLINFVPVAMGIVVDASNIAMNFFLSGASGLTSIADKLGIIGSNFAGTLQFWNPTKALGATLSSLTIVVFNLLSAAVFFLFSLLFIARYIAIWLLVILSPFAVACYVLPQTKGYFKKWLDQFVQWSILGIVAGFFLYLANQVIILTGDPSFRDKLGSMPQGGNSAIDFSQIFNSVLPMGIALALMVIGFVSSLSSGAMGASQIIGFGQKAIGSAKGFAMKRGKAFIKDSMDSKGLSWAKKLTTRMAVAPDFAAGKKGIFGGALRAALLPASMARRGAGQLISSAADQKKDADTANKAAQTRDATGNLSAYRNAVNETEREGIMRAMISKKQLKDAMNKDIVGADNVLKPEEIKKVYRRSLQIRDDDVSEGLEAATFGDTIKDAKGNVINTYEKELAKIIDEESPKLSSDPDDVTTDGLTAKDRLRFKSLNEKIVARAKTEDDIKQLKKGWYRKDDLLEAFVRQASGNQQSAAARVNGKEYIDRLVDFVASRPKGINWFVDDTTGNVQGEGTLLFLVNNAAGALGANMPLKKADGNSLERRDIQTKLNEARETRDRLKNAPKQINTDQIQEELKEAQAAKAGAEKEMGEIKKTRDEIARQIQEMPAAQWPRDLNAALKEKEDSLNQIQDNLKAIVERETSLGKKLEFLELKKERTSAKERLIELVPGPTVAEIKKFYAIIEGERKIPDKPSDSALREIRGALKAAFDAIEKSDKEILTKASLVQQKQNEASATTDTTKKEGLTREITELSEDIKDIEKKLAEYKEREKDLQEREEKIKRVKSEESAKKGPQKQK